MLFIENAWWLHTGYSSCLFQENAKESMSHVVVAVRARKLVHLRLISTNLRA